MAASRVLVLYTGGTIGMVPAHPGGPLVPGSLDALARLLPEVPGDISWTLEGLCERDSSSVGPDEWAMMAEAIGREYPSYDGFVILHGTDTMAYTASALSFMLDGLDRPVVLTGAMRPIHEANSDAAANFVNALAVAGRSAAREVTIRFGTRLLRGNRTTKVGGADAFDSPAFPPLDPGAAIPPSGARLAVRARMDRRVVVATLSPGMTAAPLERLLDGDDVKGVVLRAFGSGNAPEDAALLTAIRRAVDRGTVVVVVSQCPKASVSFGRYQAGCGLAEAGAVAGADLTVEAALTKTMWLLANAAPHEVAARLASAERGELTPTACRTAGAPCPPAG